MCRLAKQARLCRMQCMIDALPFHAAGGGLPLAERLSDRACQFDQLSDVLVE